MAKIEDKSNQTSFRVNLTYFLVVKYKSAHKLWDLKRDNQNYIATNITETYNNSLGKDIQCGKKCWHLLNTTNFTHMCNNKALNPHRYSQKSATIL